MAWPTEGYANDNFPPVWREYAPQFYNGQAGYGFRSVSGAVGRYTFIGGECVFMGSCTLNDNTEGLVVTAPLGLSVSALKVGFLHGMGGNGMPVVGRHRDSYPGSFLFVWAGDGGGGDTYPQPMKGSGLFRFSGRLPIN